MDFAFHPAALEDLDEIAAWIAESSPEAARRLIDEFFTAIELTARFPHHGMRRPELTARPLRFKLVREFLVAYAPDLNPLLVIAILDARRNPRVLASILRHRD